MTNRRVTILTAGSRGDVRPFIALGIGLQKAGYHVMVATEGGFEGFVRVYELEFAPLRADFIHLGHLAKGKAKLGGFNLFGGMKHIRPMLCLLLDDAWEAARDANALVYHPKVRAGYHIADKLGIPGFLAMMLPAHSPTGAFANPFLGAHNYGSVGNRLSYTLWMKISNAPYRGIINAWRKERLGLPPFRDEAILHGKLVPKLYAYSQFVVPKPADWDESTNVTGYWFLPQSDWLPPPNLISYLEQRPAPIYIGFGNMPSTEAAHATKIVFESARMLPQRLILATVWGGREFSRLPDTVFRMESAPHDWLFPRCAALVHHGGAGTTGAGLHAGKPTVIFPFFEDQLFWGNRVYELGVGPRPIPQKELGIEELAQAIYASTTDIAIRQRAEVLGQHIRKEDGVSRAIQIISRYLQ